MADAARDGLVQPARGALVEEAVTREPPNGVAKVVEAVKRLGITPRDEATAIIRADRDSR